MSESKGRVTIAIPTRDRLAYLRESLATARAQGYAPLEILVGDNASTDGTEAYVRGVMREDGRVRYVRHARDLGMVGNWNALLRLASGEYFLLLSDDDLLASDAVARLVEACARPGVTMAYGGSFHIDATGRVCEVSARGGPPVEAGHDFIAAHLAGERNVDLAASLYRIPAAPDARVYFSEEVGLVCDLVHRLTIAARGSVGRVPLPPVASYREHESNLTLKAEVFARSLFRVLDHPAVRAGELAAFAPAIRAAVTRKTEELATRAAARGRAEAAEAMLRVLDEHGAPTAGLRWLVRVLGWRPVRLLTAARRRWRQHRAPRRIGRLLRQAAAV